MSSSPVHAPLDLYSIALLLNYERASTEPRFRHAKLCDIATASSGFATGTQDIGVALNWTSRTGLKDGFIFERPHSISDDARDELDLPSNMLVSPAPPKLASLTPKEIETVFWQARGHDGCFKSVALLQHFFDIYPPDVPLRVRTAAGADYLTSGSTRVILELELFRPKMMTLAHVLNTGTYITGGEDTMLHAVVGFGDPESKDGNVDTVLDLASMQFGDAGRGLGGRSTFALESLDAFYDRIEAIALGADTENAKLSTRIGPCPDDPWLKQVAQRAKARWDEREKKAWCGHCGAPAKQKRCTLCHAEYYCDAVHQTAAWPFHKRFCAGKKK
ncbi:hypothetical protein FB451DRAFT_1088931 [Mycena latifolia]|nr:hypothetical protein FB451DRAFT_1088931 [Mycena latifolia]